MTARVINNHYVLPSRPQLRAIFPNYREAVVGGQTWCAIPQSLDASRMLNNMGIKTPSPIRTQYDWPGRFKPRWYQVDTAEFFTLHHRAHCHNSMRTGKTLASLWAADYLKSIGKVNRVLIVAPLSTLWDVWEQNIFESFPMRTFTTLHGDRKKRFERLNTDHDYYIINHHGVNIIQEALEHRPDIDLVIVDEVAEFFNHKAKTLWKPLNTVLNRQGINRAAWGLTGTPNPEGRPTDAFGQCKLITPENYPGHFTSFKNETMVQITQFKWVPRRGSEHIVHKVLKPSIRFERAVCTDLEPCLIERRAELSAEQEKHYKELLRSAVTEIRGTQVTALNAAILIQKISQAASGVLYGQGGEVLRIDFGPRLKVLEELIEQNQEKVVIFAPFTGVLAALAGELKKRWSVEVVEGDTSTSKRTQIFRDFRSNKDPHIILAHPQCMAHGLDLTTASMIIFYAPLWSNKIYSQACARIDGSGQKVKIDIAHIYATAEEHRIYKALAEKKKLQDVVLELSKNIQVNPLTL
jgi:superfamily II DNA or RNA helicase